MSDLFGTEPLDDPDVLAQLALDLRGGTVLREGFGAEIAELLEQGSQDVTVVNAEILRRLEEDPENTAVVRMELTLDFRTLEPPRSKIKVIQFFYLIRGENKNWVILDASYPS